MAAEPRPTRRKGQEPRPAGNSWPPEVWSAWIVDIVYRFSRLLFTMLAAACQGKKRRILRLPTCRTKPPDDERQTPGTRGQPSSYSDRPRPGISAPLHLLLLESRAQGVCRTRIRTQAVQIIPGIESRPLSIRC